MSKKLVKLEAKLRKANPKISKAYKTLFEIYQDLGQFEEVLEFHKKFHKVEKEITP